MLALTAEGAIERVFGVVICQICHRNTLTYFFYRKLVKKKLTTKKLSKTTHSSAIRMFIGAI